MVGVQRTEGSSKNEENGCVLATSLTACRRRRKYASNGIVAGDESWVDHCQPESNRASMQWKYPSSSSTKNFKVTSMPSAGNYAYCVLGFSGST
jgi:hypothetical protein